MKKNVMANVPNKMKFIVAAVLAILIIAGLLPVGLTLFVKADNVVGDYTYANHFPEITLDGTTGTAGEAIKRNEFGKYTVGGQTYVFKAVRDIEPGETMTVNGDTIILAPRTDESIADNLAELVNVTTEGGVYTLTLKPETLLVAGQPYFYDIDGEVYSFIPSQDIGYTAPAEDDGDARTDTVNPKSFSQNGAGTGTATITIDTVVKTLSVSAKQYTRKVIYHETNDFSPGKVYLVGAKADAADSKMNLITLDPSSTYRLSETDTGSNNTVCVHYPEGEDVVRYSLIDQWANYNRARNDKLVQFQRGNASPYDTSSGTTSTIVTNGFNYYFEDNEAGDAWVNSELKTQHESNTFSDGNILMAYIADEKDYTQDRVFGSINSSDTSIQAKLHFHKDCFGSTAFVIEHNNGNIWSYTTQSSSTGNKYGYLKNGNTLSTNVLQALNGNPNLYYGGSTSPANAAETPLSGTRNNSSPIYLFEKKTVYEEDLIETTEKVTPETSGIGLTMQGHALRTVRATLDYDGAKIANGTQAEKDALKAKQFTVVFTLTDFDGLPVNGTFTLDGFATGNTVGTLDKQFVNGRLENNVLMKDGTYIEFADGLPDGFTLTPSIVEVSSRTDADRGNYTFMQGPNGIGAYAADYVANGTPVTVDGDEDIRLDVRDPKREVDIRLEYNANGTVKNKEFGLALYMTDMYGNPFSGTVFDLQGNQYLFSKGSCTTRNGSEAINLHHGQTITLTGIQNGSKLGVSVRAGLASYDAATVKSQNATITQQNQLLIEEDKSSTQGNHIQINVSIQKMDMEIVCQTDGLNNMTSTNGAGAYIYVYRNETLYKKIYIGDYNSGSYLRSKSVTITVPDVEPEDNIYAKVIAGTEGGGNGEYAKVLLNGAAVGLAKNRASSTSYSYNSSSSVHPNFTKSTTENSNKTVVGSDASITQTAVTTWADGTPNINTDEPLPHQPRNTIKLTYSYSNDSSEITIQQKLVHGNPNKLFPVSLRVWSNHNTGKISRGWDYFGSLGVYNFVKPSANEADDTDKAVEYAEKATLKSLSSGTNATRYYQVETTNNPLLELAANEKFSINLPYSSSSEDVRSIDVRSDGARFYDTNKNYIAGGYITKFSLTENYSTGQFDVPQSTGPSGTKTAGKYRLVTPTDTKKTIYVFRDIIPQEVKVTLETDSETVKNNADKKRLFDVKVVLYRDTGEYAEGESYQVLTQSIEACNDHPENFLVNGAETETEFNGREGATFKMADGQSLYFQLPWGYRAEVTANDGQVNYTTSYETCEESFTAAGKDYHFTVTPQKTNTVTAAATNYDISKDDNAVAVALAANTRVTDQEIKVIKTRNAVPDDIGLFGGKANKAFLALVGTLTTIAVAAYLYSKRYTETED